MMMNRLLTIVVLLLACVDPSADHRSAAAEPSEAASLWQTVLPPSGPDPAVAQRKAWVLQEREIALDVALLHVLKDAGARPHRRIFIELFDGNRPELDIISTVSRINNTAVVRGTFKPPARGEFTFLATGNIVTGSAQVGDRLYKIEHIVNGRLKLLEVDPAKVPPE